MYLGVTINNTVSWDAHISNTCSKAANRALGFLILCARACVCCVWAGGVGGGGCVRVRACVCGGGGE